MSRRIEIELTSSKDDGTWTWRAAGAKQPKGTLEGSLLYEGAGVGDVVRADADFDIDGITVTAVLPPKGPRKEPERIEIIGRPAEGGVTSQLSRKGKGDGRGKGKGRRDRKAKSDREGHGDRGPRGRGKEGGERRERRERKPRQEQPAEPPKPKPKRLRPQRVHRNAVLDTLDEKQRPVAEQVLRGGVPAVRKWVEDQAGDGPSPDPAPFVALAEDLLPRLRTAEWHDRADAALKDIDEVDLRDLRSVVVASQDAAKDDETRALAEQVKEGLSARVDKEHQAWLDEVAATLADGRVVRALRLSSRPPKAGAPLPPELAERLTAAAAAALTADIAQQRWAAVLEAVALSPVRRQVLPEGLPAQPGDELMAMVRQTSMETPQIAKVFGVEPAPPPRRPRRRKPGAGKPSSGKAAKGARRQRPVDTEPKAEQPTADEPKAEQPTADETEADEPKAEQPTADEPKAEQPTADEPKAEEPTADEPKADEPKAEQPTADEPKAEEPTADEPKAEEPKAEEPTADEPKAEQPTADEPKADEPKAETEADEPKAEQPTADEPAPAEAEAARPG